MIVSVVNAKFFSASSIFWMRLESISRCWVRNILASKQETIMRSRDSFWSLTVWSLLPRLTSITKTYAAIFTQLIECLHRHTTFIRWINFEVIKFIIRAELWFIQLWVKLESLNPLKNKINIFSIELGYQNFILFPMNKLITLLLGTLLLITLY